MTRDRGSAVTFGVAVHVARFGVIMGALWLAPALGITGWSVGLFANAVCAIFAIVLVTQRKLWRTIGMTTPWRGRTAALALLVLLAEAVFWVLPDGLVDQPPGFGLWGLTLLLVGFNEELVSRGVVLDRLSKSFTAVPAVTVTGLLFGLQHLSLFATSDRGVYDIVTNVLMSATYGFALAAFQIRFAWIWPLILLHAFADFTTILTRAHHSDPVIAVTAVVLVLYGSVVLRGARAAGPPDPTRSTVTPASAASPATPSARSHPSAR